MSVALLVKSELTGETELTSVAAEAAFERFWRPGIVALGLDCVDPFQSGFAIEQPDIPPVLEQLDRLRVWMSRSGTPADVIDRLDRLRAKLEMLKGRSDVDAWIG